MKISLGHRPLTVGEIAGICRGELNIPGCSGELVYSVCTDSREAGAGVLFLAFSGANVDGSNYIASAVKLGAVCALSEKIPESAADCPVVIVRNQYEALGRLAAFYSSLCPAKRIAVTGSVGKTTTKEFIAAALSKKKVHKSIGNANSIIGMPLTVLAMPEDAEYAVIECGINHPGEMTHMSDVVRPDIAVITNIGSSHLEYFGTRENIAAEKCAIASAMKKDGIFLLNAEEPLLEKYIADDPRARTFASDGSVRADYVITGLCREGMSTVFGVRTPCGIIDGIRVPVVGKHLVTDALIGVAAADAAGMPADDIREGILSFRNAPMRQEVRIIGGRTVINDCYNASPESMRTAAELLCDSMTGDGRRIAVLGDMYELGDNWAELHESVGRYFAGKGTDAVVAFGEQAMKIADGAAECGTAVYRFPDLGDPAAAADCVMNISKPGDRIIIKASRGVQAERIAGLMEKITG